MISCTRRSKRKAHFRAKQQITSNFTYIMFTFDTKNWSRHV